MKALGKPYKFGMFQIQEIIDNYNVRKVQIKYFNRGKSKKPMFNRFQAIYVMPNDWKLFKKEIKKAG